MPRLSFVGEFGRDVDVVELRTLARFVPDDALHFDEVHHPLEVVFGADRNHDGHGVSLEALLHLVDDLEEVGAGAVHLVHERDAGHMVLVGLTPHRFRLGLNAAHSAVNHHRAVQHTHGAFHFDREVDVPRGIDDVETVGLILHVHAAPVAGRSGGRNGDTTFLFLFHPVHGGSAVMHFAELVVHAREEQNTFGRRGLARVDVGRNTDIAVARNRSSTSHDLISS